MDCCICASQVLTCDNHIEGHQLSHSVKLEDMDWMDMGWITCDNHQSWRYCTIFLAIFWGISPYIALKNRPYIWYVPPFQDPGIPIEPVKKWLKIRMFYESMLDDGCWAHWLWLNPVKSVWRYDRTFVQIRPGQMPIQTRIRKYICIYIYIYIILAI